MSCDLVGRSHGPMRRRRDVFVVGGIPLNAGDELSRFHERLCEVTEEVPIIEYTRRETQRFDKLKLSPQHPLF